MTTATFSAAEPLPTRIEGPVFGALRFVRLTSEFLWGVANIEVAGRRHGELAAKKEFALAVGRLARTLGVEIIVDGELDPDADEIRVANHTSYLDIFVLGSLRTGRFLSRHDVGDWPLVGRVAKNIGTLFVDRDSKESRADALGALGKAARHGALLVFPEGKTYKKPGAFKLGAFVVARAAKRPVRPIALHWSDVDAAAWIDDMTLPPHLFQRLSGGFIRVRVQPLATLDPAGRPAAQVAREARTAILAALAAG